MELPIGATSIGMPPEGRKTGLWRYMRPSFEEMIPSCQEACPLGNWIQRFLAGVTDGDLEGAWWALRLENPFPGVCGRVCYHTCEESCNRKELDGATSIQAIERNLADRFFDKQVKAPLQIEKQGRKIAVVGSGPAGMACAYFLTLMGYEVTVFEAQNVLGGVPQVGIPAYRLPREILNKEIEDIVSLGVEVKTGCEAGKDIKFSELLEYDALFLATGAHREPPLNIPGEDSEGVLRGLDFLNRFQHKKSIDLGEKVLVIGGGNVAIDVIRTLIRQGRRPSLLYRRTRNEMPAFAEEIEEALNEGAKIDYLLSPTAIRRSDGEGLLIECSRMKIEGKDADGRSRAVPIEGDDASFQADQVILATGEVPDLSYLPQDFRLKKGLISINEWGQTNLEKVFAGGDIVDQTRSVSIAIGSAKRAAIAMDNYLRGRDLQKISKEGSLARTMREHLGIDQDAKGDRKVATFQELNLAYITPAPRDEQSKLSAADRKGNFKEVNIGMTADKAAKEAGRCLSCGVCKKCGNCYLFCPDGAVQLDSDTGCYVIDYDFCKGCGVCQNECPVGAIVIEAEGDE